MADERRRANDAGGDEDISLASLTAAFAEVLGKADADGALGTAGQLGSDENAAAQNDVLPNEQVPASASEEPPPTPLAILEAMLFVGHPQNAPLTAQEAASVMRGVEPAEIHELVGQLNRRYDTQGCPYRIASEGAGYRLVLREEFHGLRDKFYGRVKAARLSQAAVECLALVAYNQPLAREEIDSVRGVASAHVLAQLVRRRLLRIERTETQPRQTLYYTTRRFLTLLGLEKLDDLPQTRELERP
jgi:segregation and condensation protein B